MKTISANDLKTRGVSIIQRALERDSEVLISVRGKDRYVVMDLEEFNRLRVCELEAALYETRQQIAAGDFIEESVEEHMARIKAEAKRVFASSIHRATSNVRCASSSDIRS